MRHGGRKVSGHRIGVGERASTGENDDHRNRLDDLWTIWVELTLELEVEAILRRRLGEHPDRNCVLKTDGPIARCLGVVRFRSREDLGVVAFLRGAICSTHEMLKPLTSEWFTDRFRRLFLPGGVREAWRSYICSVWPDRTDDLLSIPDEQTWALSGSRSNRRAKKSR
jgi:hypothetical protein